MTSIQLDPSAVLDFDVDWTAWLQAGEAITSQTVTALDTAGHATAVPIANVTQAAGVVTFWAGPAGAYRGTLRLTTHITTSQNRQDDRTIVVQVVER